MRLANYVSNGSSPHVGAVIADGTEPHVVELTGPLSDLGVGRMEELVAIDGPAWRVIGEMVAGGELDHLPHHPLGSVALLPPVTAPSQMLYVRANYPQPDGSIPDLERPAFFSKLPGAMVPEGADVLLPPMAAQPDWEGELALIIGRHASHVATEEAMGCVAGYTITNDITARDLQASGEPTLAKNFRTFAPLGPWLVTPDEVGDPHHLGIRQWVNGTLFQDGNTSDMIFDIPEIIVFLSSIIDLHPGDVVATGAPAGTGKQQQPPVFLQDGDTMRIEIDGIGTLSNRALVARS